MVIELGRIGAWLNQVYGDEDRIKYAVEAERYRALAEALLRSPRGPVTC
ncbi:MAG TPA: hypothetical protein VH141_09495 [Pseudonocardia sp.]|jgi:hypothetical protein|nr:hypothetical protein [Pseudonocardia sp.]